MILTILSPDKLTPIMFCDFFSKTYLKDQKVGIADCSVLYDRSIQAGQYKTLADLKDMCHSLIKYKVKQNTPVDSLPEIVFTESDYIIKFDLYSTHPEVIKAEDEDYLKGVIEQWDLAIKKMESF